MDLVPFGRGAGRGRRAMRGMFTLAFAAAGLCCATARAQRAVYVIRHAERQGESLSAAGLARADRLADLLEHAGITTICTTQIERTKQTADPLRKRLEGRGLAVRARELPLPDELLRDPANAALLSAYGESVAAALRAGGPDEIVLVVGHDVMVPAVVRGLGASTDVVIAPDEFDHLFVVIPRAEGDERPAGVLHLRQGSE